MQGVQHRLLQIRELSNPQTSVLFGRWRGRTSESSSSGAWASASIPSIDLYGVWDSLQLAGQLDDSSVVLLYQKRDSFSEERVGDASACVRVRGWLEVPVLRCGVADGGGCAAPYGGACGREGVPLHDLQIQGQHVAWHAHTHTYALPEEAC